MNAVRMDVSSKTRLKQQLKFSYESFPGSSQFADGSSPSGFTCGLDRNHGERIQTRLKQHTGCCCVSLLLIYTCHDANLQHCGCKLPE